LNLIHSNIFIIVVVYAHIIIITTGAQILFFSWTIEQAYQKIN
jgi:hypothetical protein